uniref:Uncharacterized protein n=1 Tax=Moniliophthora roreri TaxID=221103 RepID=A0A0W0FX94_MONRR
MSQSLATRVSNHICMVGYL